MHQLNPKQKKAASFKEGICSVIAIPGSGKTLTMTERIGLLVRHHNISPESILGLTFTRSAAQAMRDRLEQVLGEVASRVTLSTTHSFCLSLLRTEGRAFEIISGKDQNIFLKKVIQRLKIKDLSTGLVLRNISLAKSNLISVEEFNYLYSGDDFMLGVADVYEAYEEEKERRMLLDLDDLLFEAHRLLNDEQVRKKYQSIYRHVLVDEFQDTNPAQVQLITLLTNGAGNSSLWVCGDEMQSIFSFIGSSVSLIQNFKKIFPKSKQVVLDLNYRSTPQILKVCQNLMKHNSRRIKKKLKTLNEDGDDVVVIESESEEDEAVQVANEILDLVNRKGHSCKEIAVLYRANFQSRVLEEAFSEEKIPYHVENGLFYRRYEIRILLDYLRLIMNPNSDEGDEALRNIVNIPNRYIGKSFMHELEAFSIEKELHLFRAMEIMPIGIPYLRKNVKEFIKLLNPLIKKANKMEPAELIYLLRESLDYDSYITDDEVPTADDMKIANLNQLQLAASSFTDIRAFLDYTETFQEDLCRNKDGVSLMTVHKSKGLEFQVVFVVGLVEGLMPHKQGEIEEERRICFVALSRAMKKLYLSHSQSYLGKPAAPSIFLEEIAG